LRILYVNSNLARLHTAPGIWGCQVLDALRAAGANITTSPDVRTDGAIRPDAGTRGWGLRGLLEQTLPRRLTMLLREGYLLTRGLLNSARTALRCWRQRKTLDVDVVLGRHVEYECSANIAARILRTPLVMEVHSPTFMEHRAFGLRASRVTQAVERGLWKRCARIWVNSDNLKAIVVGNGIEASRVRTIPFGVALNSRRIDAAASQRETVEVAFVGSFYPWHGADVLLRAFAAARRAAPGLRLTLAGDGYERTHCESLTRELGLTDVVTFPGRLPHDEALALLARADIGVAPYAPMERFYFDPAKILEYQASGLAIVASDQGRVSEMLEGGRSGILVPPGDEGALRGALVRLATDESLRRTLGEAALQCASRRGWDHVAPLILEVLREAIAQPMQRP
jgi:glycosyltransferase involved in cell wall biosynthesis